MDFPLPCWVSNTHPALIWPGKCKFSKHCVAQNCADTQWNIFSAWHLPALKWLKVVEGLRVFPFIYSGKPVCTHSIQCSEGLILYEDQHISHSVDSFEGLTDLITYEDWWWVEVDRYPLHHVVQRRAGYTVKLKKPHVIYTVQCPTAWHRARMIEIGMGRLL